MQDELKKAKNDALLAVLARESQLEADLAAKAALARRQAEDMKLAAAALARTSANCAKYASNGEKSTVLISPCDRQRRNCSAVAEDT